MGGDLIVIFLQMIIDMKKIGLTIIAVILSLTVYAEDAVLIDGIYYNLVTKAKIAEVTYKPIRMYGYYKGNIVIPEHVTYNGVEHTVTSIGEEAFQYCDKLTSVIMPNTITTIGNRAFCGCYKLISVLIPNSVNVIGVEAFGNCIGMESITIGNNVTTIGIHAFNSCWKLATIDIPNSVTSIGNGAFGDCTSLTSITLGKNVTAIGSAAFQFCTKLPKIIIPSSVTTIEFDAFQGCDELTSIIIDSTNPKYDSRDNCNAVIETQSNKLILGCNNTTIPNSVTTIGYNAFILCRTLPSITIPSSVVSIEEYAFSNCIALTSISIPNSVTEMRDGVFFKCGGLISVNLPNGLTKIGRDFFWKCSNLKSIIIPNSVTEIEYDAFRECTSLTTVVLGDNINFVNTLAFYGCKELTDFYCHTQTVPKTYEDAFNNAFVEYATLHVPASSIDAYKATKPWSDFGKIVALTDSDPKPSAINTISVDGDNDIKYYTIDGKPINEPRKGINIMKRGNGSTKKVIIR